MEDFYVRNVVQPETPADYTPFFTSPAKQFLMDIVEEVARRRVTIELDDPEQAYPEIRDLLERRMSFDEVVEDKYFHDVEDGTVRSRITTVEGYDMFTVEEIEIYLFISKNQRELDVQIKAKLVTTYPEKYSFQKTLWYYAYRSMYDKFLYGSVREEFEPAVEHKADELLQRIRDNLEA